MSRWLPVLMLAAAGSAGAQTPPEAAAQRDAIAKLAWMAGRWEGTSTSLVREGQVRATSSEWMKIAAGGTALVILGVHHRVMPDGSRGEVTHDAAGMITWDNAKQKYRFTAHIDKGRHGDFEGVMDGDTFVWSIPIPQGSIRYRIRRNEAGQYTEKGELCPNSQSVCAPTVFEMLLDRKGDAQ
jgi:hypothetical protein